MTTPTSQPLGPLAQRALAIRRRVLQHQAQVAYDPKLWPGWWDEEAALRAISYLRDAGVVDDPVEAAVLLVGCAYQDEDTDRQISGLGGEVVMAVKVLQGRPSDYAERYWRTLREDSLVEHQLARAAIQLALLEEARVWAVRDWRRRKVWGTAVHQVAPMLAAMGGEPARRMERVLAVRVSMLRRESVGGE